VNSRGISLIEILVASSIMVAALVPLWGLMGSSHKQVTLSADEIKASQLAAEMLEQIENSHWFPEIGEITFLPMSQGKMVLGSTVKFELQVGSFPEYMDLKAKLKIEKYPASGPEYGRIIRVILHYKSKEKVGTPEKDYELATYISKK